MSYSSYRFCLIENLKKTMLYNSTLQDIFTLYHTQKQNIYNFPLRGKNI